MLRTVSMVLVRVLVQQNHMNQEQSWQKYCNREWRWAEGQAALPPGAQRGPPPGGGLPLSTPTVFLRGCEMSLTTHLAVSPSCRRLAKEYSFTSASAASRAWAILGSQICRGGGEGTGQTG